MDDLQNFVDVMRTDNDAVDKALHTLQLSNVGTDAISHVEALRIAVKEQRQLLKHVQVVLLKENDNLDFSELLGLTEESFQPDNLTATLGLSPLHIPVTMMDTMFNSIMHAFQAAKVLYDKKYDSCGDEDIAAQEQANRMKPFATAALSTVNAWGGASGTINLDIQRWDADKTSIMRRLMVEACKQNPVVKSSLLKTTGDIYEDTLPDHFWGYCKGRGQNTTGELWKNIRDNESFDISESLEPKKKKAKFHLL